MIHVDYIMVGCGLAGIAFCEHLKENNKSFVVFDNNSQQASAIAGGLYNPVILKRLTSVWKSEEQLQIAHPMYSKLENELSITINAKIPVYRRFASQEEQNNWFEASDKPILSKYLSPKIIKNNNAAIDAPFGFGEVLHTGKIDTKKLLHAYQLALLKKNSFFKDEFIYSKLKVDKKKVRYANIISKHIVFAEGFGIKQNPFFKQLPLNEAKGELLTIKAPKLKIDFVLKSNIFVIPQENDLYTIGSTYAWKDKTHNITAKAKKELLQKFKTIVNCPFELVNQVAGIRPTVIDRRPLVGSHKDHSNVSVLNGLGTRGVMLAPYLAKQLYNHIENNRPLEKELDIKRFE